jgi:hypothetical protein
MSGSGGEKMGGILLLGDAIIGNPPGALSLIPEPKLDDPSKLKRPFRFRGIAPQRRRF